MLALSTAASTAETMHRFVQQSRRWWQRVALSAGLAAVPALAPAAEHLLVLQGSTTFNLELLLEHQHEVEDASRVKLSVFPNKSNLGLVALLQGRADLAMISVPLENEVGILRLSNPELPFDSLQAFEVARTRATLIVNANNPVRIITDDDLRGVLTGAISNWRQLGGNDLPIRIVAVREGGGVVTTVEAAALGAGQHINAPYQIRVQNGPQVAGIVQQEEGALGITQVKSIGQRRVVELSTKRPFEQVLFLVSAGPPTPVMRAVIDACSAVAARGTM